MARPAPLADGRTARRWRHREGTGPMRACTRPRAAARGAERPRGRPGKPRGDRAARGPRVRPGAARLPAARGGRRAPRPALSAQERARITDGAAVARGRAARARGRDPAWLPRDARPRPRRRRRRDPHLRHDRGPEPGRADLRRTCCGARSVRRSRSGVDRDERWLCALPLAHVGGLSILLRSAIYATTAVVHERFEVDRVLHDLRARRATAR